MRSLNRFRRDRSGNIAITFAMALVPAAGLAGASVDYSRASRLRAALQAETDSAALNAAQRGTTDGQRQAIVSGYFPAAQAQDPRATVTDADTGVTVTATQTVPMAFMGMVGITTAVIQARSTALYAVAGPPVCVLALNRAASGAVAFGGNTNFSAPHCAVYSNSSSQSGITLQGSASVRAAGYCSVGGVSGTFSPAAKTGCWPAIDPFRNTPKPTIGACDKTNLSVGPNSSKTLNPGVYCRGMDLKGTVTLTPGLYIVKDGALSIGSQANVTVSGSGGVTFYLTGTGALLDMNGSGGVSLTAQSSGPYAGLLVIQDRDSNAGATSKLNGNSSTVLKGAIYLPTQALSITGNNSFGQQSGFMPMIADTLSFSGSSVASLDVPLTTAAALPTIGTPARLVE